jgi:prolyl-tRNA editing enzyme YbaK/EbsC (Cys-tRNA(Pro) deacylase)
MSDDAVIEARVAQALEGLGAPWELMRIDPEFADTAAFCEKYGVALDHSGNTIIVASKKEPKKYCACLVLATTRLDVNHVVRRLLEVPRVSFATAEETRELTGMLIGGVTLLALPPDLPLYVDDRVMALDYVILGGGSRSSKIKIAPDALRKLPGFTVVTGLAQAIA